ncbi:MAG TPA: alpha/beta fold hydrolase [Vicinamibacterales bacterium]|nr:alpha/beta fold hydrolase [Vicinamibacterales bacterium]
MSTQQPVIFTSRKGLRLFGILTSPRAGARSDLGVILLSPGVKMRVGPQRLYRRMARVFASMGLPVLSFDFEGLGDSEGALKEELLKDVYNHIEVGRFVDDTVDAMNWMQQHLGTKRFILSGLCGGAITGLLTGSRDPRVAGLLALGITPLLASRAADPALYMTARERDEMRQWYIDKLFSPKAWARLLTFQSDYRVIWRLLPGFVRRQSKEAADAAAPPPPPPAEYDNASPLFPPAFFSMLTAKKPMLLVFGGSDRLHWEFDEKFMARHKGHLDTLPQLYDVHVIKDANHVLSFEEWQREMLDVSTAWLHRHFERDVSPAPALALQPAG